MAAGAADAFLGFARAYLVWTAPLLIVLGVAAFMLGGFVLSMGAHEPDDSTVRAWIGSCAIPVAIGWLLTVYLGLAPC